MTPPPVIIRFESQKTPREVYEHFMSSMREAVHLAQDDDALLEEIVQEAKQIIAHAKHYQWIISERRREAVFAKRKQEESRIKNEQGGCYDVPMD